MSVLWFKQWLGRGKVKKISLADVAASVTALSRTIASSDSGVQKGLRRLSLAQKQQNDAIATLTYEFTSLKCAIANRHGVVLTYEQIMRLLDHLAKINHASSNLAGNTTNNRDVIAPLVARATEDLLFLCELEAVAEVCHPYPSHGCEVVGAVEEPRWQPGTVHEILQQGYQTPDGDIVRAAKVIVCREADTEQDITQQDLAQQDFT